MQDVWLGGAAVFSAGGSPLTVNLFGDGRAIAWQPNGNDGIAGTMMLSSPTAKNVVTLQNAINLNGHDASGNLFPRTIFVDDNPGSTGDYAVISGVIANGFALDANGNVTTTAGTTSQLIKKKPAD